MVGGYQIYNDQHLVSKLNEEAIKHLSNCRGTLKDTLQLEDYEEEGVVPLGAIKEAFVTLDIELEEDLMDYLLYVIYSKSETIERMNYNALFDLLDGKLAAG